MEKFSTFNFQPACRADRFSKKGRPSVLHPSSGFTLFFSMLIGSLLLAIGIAIFNISIKELSLSTTGRESQFAFYAADTGVECALYWDIRGGAFATSTASNPPTEGVMCNGQDLRSNTDGVDNEWEILSIDNQSATTRFKLFFDPDDLSKPCVEVKVIKTRDEGIIEARGQNKCSGNPSSRTERGIRVTF